MQRFQNWKEATIDAFVLAMHRLQAFYVNEIQRGLAGIGTYRLKDCYTHERKDAAELQVYNVVYISLISISMGIFQTFIDNGINQA